MQNVQWDVWNFSLDIHLHLISIDREEGKQSYGRYNIGIHIYGIMPLKDRVWI